MKEAVKKEAPVKKMPNKATEPEPKKVEFYFDEQGINRVNNFLGLVNSGESEGVIEYKAAFQKLVAIIQTSLKQR